MLMRFVKVVCLETQVTSLRLDLCTLGIKAVLERWGTLIRNMCFSTQLSLIRIGLTPWISIAVCSRIMVKTRLLGHYCMRQNKVEQMAIGGLYSFNRSDLTRNPFLEPNIPVFPESLKNEFGLFDLRRKFPVIG